MEIKKKPTTVVISKLEAKLAEDNARMAVEMEEERKANKKKRMRIALLVAVILMVVSAVVFFLIIILSGRYNPGQTNPGEDEDDGTTGMVLPSIEGYHCTTELCMKVAELTENTILVRDTDYFIFNRETREAVRTTIDAVEYRSFTPFTWGDSLLLILERTTGRQGLYSISANRRLTLSFNYTAFERDINAPVYRGMEWVKGLYILARIADEVRLIDIRNGAEVVRSAERIFVHRDFIIGYEVAGQRRVYTMAGSRVLIVEAGVLLAIYEQHLVRVRGAQSMEIYNNGGTQLKSSDDFYRHLREKLRAVDRRDYAVALRGLSGAFIIPD